MNLIITIISIYKICTSSGRPGSYPEEDLIPKKKKRKKKRMNKNFFKILKIKKILNLKLKLKKLNSLLFQVSVNGASLWLGP